jgi:hypothetical protein
MKVDPRDARRLVLVLVIAILVFGALYYFDIDLTHFGSDSAGTDGFIVYLLLAVFLGAVAGRIAKNKGYDTWPVAIAVGIAAAISFWILGILGIIIIACLPHKKIICPGCGQRVVHSSKYCPFCKHTFTVGTK